LTKTQRFDTAAGRAGTSVAVKLFGGRTGVTVFHHTTASGDRLNAFDAGGALLGRVDGRTRTETWRKAQALLRGTAAAAPAPAPGAD
jgi:hypothetical protein